MYWPHRLMVRTAGFQSVNRSSTLRGVTLVAAQEKQFSHPDDFLYGFLLALAKKICKLASLKQCIFSNRLLRKKPKNHKGCEELFFYAAYSLTEQGSGDGDEALRAEK